MKTLEGVDLEQAMARHLVDRHTIWDLVDHTTFWLEAAVNMVLDELAGWSDEDLESTVPGKDCKFRQMLHGAVHHNLYHAGQISLLKKKA